MSDTRSSTGKRKMTSSEAWTIGIAVFDILLLAGYVIFCYEMFKQQKFIFKKYTPPTPPGNHKQAALTSLSRRP